MIVVTGGAGFIGANLLADLETTHGTAKLVVCDRLATGDKWRNIAKRSLFDIIPPDKILEFLNKTGSGVSAVFHLGAESSTTATDADAIVANNFRFSQHLWHWCTQANVPLIYASSAATYGNGDDGFDDDPAPNRLARLRPNNLYGWSKLLFDRWAIAAAARGEAPPQWAGLRFFNVYGPNESHKGAQRSVVPQLFAQIAETGRAKLFRSQRQGIAGGEQKRDFVHVDDCCAVMLWLFDNPTVSGLFNVGTGQARTFLDLAHAVFTAMDLPPNIEFIDAPPQVERHYQYFTEALIERLRAAGYDAPFIDLESGVASYVRDYLASSDPYR